MAYDVKCNNCEKIHELDPYLEVTGDDPDREMGIEYFYSGYEEVICTCGNEITISIEGSEYPEDAGIEIYNISVTGGKLV